MFDGFSTERLSLDEGIDVHLRVGGAGPPLLLLHGYPQTHVIWHKIAPSLAKRYTVVAADLRGYGDSSKPDGGANHENYSFRAMAKDQVAVMEALGFKRFMAVGHDRGARVIHRMALDHPDRVEKAVLMDILPTLFMYENTDMSFARGYFHWFFLNRKLDCPLHILWGRLGIVGQLFDVLTPWRERANDVSGRSLDCGHYLAEEAPKETLAEIFEFLTLH